MLLVAAEGGGIRAAYWTVRGLEAMGEYTCAGRSVLFSAGASGGSVGLTVARFSGTATDPGITRAVEAIQQMAGPGTLSEAADGTFIRDTFYGATGVPLPLLPSRHARLAVGRPGPVDRDRMAGRLPAAGSCPGVTARS